MMKKKLIGILLVLMMLSIAIIAACAPTSYVVTIIAAENGAALGVFHNSQRLDLGEHDIPVGDTVSVEVQVQIGFLATLHVGEDRMENISNADGIRRKSFDVYEAVTIRVVVTIDTAHQALVAARVAAIGRLDAEFAIRFPNYALYYADDWTALLAILTRERNVINAMTATAAINALTFAQDNQTFWNDFDEIYTILDHAESGTQELAAARANAVTRLNNHFNANFDEDDYLYDDWNILLGLLQDEVNAINAMNLATANAFAATDVDWTLFNAVLTEAEQIRQTNTSNAQTAINNLNSVIGGTNALAITNALGALTTALNAIGGVNTNALIWAPHVNEDALRHAANTRITALNNTETAQTAISELQTAIAGSNALAITNALGAFNAAFSAEGVIVASLNFTPHANADALRDAANQRVNTLDQNHTNAVNAINTLLQAIEGSVIADIITARDALTEAIVTLEGVRQNELNFGDGNDNRGDLIEAANARLLVLDGVHMTAQNAIQAVLNAIAGTDAVAISTALNAMTDGILNAVGVRYNDLNFGDGNNNRSDLRTQANNRITALNNTASAQNAIDDLLTAIGLRNAANITSALNALNNALLPQNNVIENMLVWGTDPYNSRAALETAANNRVTALNNTAFAQTRIGELLSAIAGNDPAAIYDALNAFNTAFNAERVVEGYLEFDSHNNVTELRNAANARRTALINTATAQNAIQAVLEAVAGTSIPAIQSALADMTDAVLTAEGVITPLNFGTHANAAALRLYAQARIEHLESLTPEAIAQEAINALIVAIGGNSVSAINTALTNLTTYLVGVDPNHTFNWGTGNADEQALRDAAQARITALTNTQTAQTRIGELISAIAGTNVVAI
ncbi:MAG: hypothetical protein FWE22_08395, partial [Firmicutes bacterium]|nr:hypothetical protein [Bacillota bacterium]